MKNFLLKFLFLKESWNKMSRFLKKKLSTTDFKIDNNKEYFWAPNQHIRMISKGSFSFAITRINYIWKYNKVVKSYFSIVIFHNVTVFFITKSALVCIRDFFQKQKK